ncbi:hypothetical protein [Paenibacillus sp. IHBB 3054]
MKQAAFRFLCGGGTLLAFFGEYYCSERSSAVKKTAFIVENLHSLL